MSWIISTFIHLVFWYLNLCINLKLSVLAKGQLKRVFVQNKNIVLYSKNDIELISLKEKVSCLIFIGIAFIYPCALFCVFITFLGTLLNVLCCVPEYSNLCEKNKLSIGYGCALCYYKNYLVMVLPHSFIKRIEYFKTYHNVEVKNKLFILFPQSCKVQKYIDSPDLGNIERCGELQEHVETVAGIKDRTYNITVYHIKIVDIPKGARLAIEYAMPLKGLHTLKENLQISKEEMVYQRQLFIEVLYDFLVQDANGMIKYCELIEYDDSKDDLAMLLLEKSGIHCKNIL